MSQLRDTLLELQKEKTLRLLLGNRYDQATDAEKQHYLSVVGTQIENDVDVLLHQHVINYQSNTPVSRKGKKLKWVYIIVNVVLTILGAYAVNEKAWVYVVGIGIMTAINQCLPFIYERD
ncbi:hypothetical protein [Bacillus toyonensis]|uniref:hypothetical protein n=1 Tax=Bacillus toyonensis TaxID=155322 RepID=UPI000BED4136|nr:hypothetical protein [Bacillus toyonensis]PED63149.1 hypothetical protein CON89_02045 [Bacillus toyonensis]PEN38116.1 hypothetical protein CN541_15590 [Bacillus toyonensis]